jgi:hypothetical protein
MPSMVGGGQGKKTANYDNEEAQVFIDSPDRLGTKAKFNLENLVKIDEKLQ